MEVPFLQGSEEGIVNSGAEAAALDLFWKGNWHRGQGEADHGMVLSCPVDQHAYPRCVGTVIEQRQGLGVCNSGILNVGHPREGVGNSVVLTPDVHNFTLVF
jgi:hypothetical protein